MPPGPGAVSGDATADAAKASEAVAGAKRRAARGLLSAGARTRTAGAERFHVHERTAGDDRRPALQTPALSLNVDLFELGVGPGLFFGVVREPGVRGAGRLVGVGGSAARTPYRLAHGSGPTAAQ